MHETKGSSSQRIWALTRRYFSSKTFEVCQNTYPRLHALYTMVTSLNTLT